MLSRWQSLIAEQSARVSTGSASAVSSPTRASAFLFRPRFTPGARLRRLLLVLAGLFLLTICMFHLNDQGHSLSVSGGGSWHLPWGGGMSAEEKKAKAEAAEAAALEAEKSLLAEMGDSEYDTTTTTHLPHIPPKIWQIYLDFKPTVVSITYLASWLAHSPSYSYTLLDAGGALSMVRRLVGMATAKGGSWKVPIYPNTFKQSTGPSTTDAEATENEETDIPDVEVELGTLDFARDALKQYTAMPRRVLRADFMRYLALALEGGIYSDMDTSLVKPIGDWVPEEFRAETRLIVGLESDSSPPVKGTTYEVQFCQWTLASAPDHPTLWTMLDRILAKVGKLKGGLLGDKLSDTNVLEITGPAAWTEVVFEHLNQVAGTGVGKPRITWETLTGMTEPQLYGDTLVLPIDGFATGVPHSHASRVKSKQTLIQHQFQGNWRDDKG